MKPIDFSVIFLFEVSFVFYSDNKVISNTLEISYTFPQYLKKGFDVIF